MLGISNFTAPAVSRTDARTLMGFDIVGRLGTGAGSVLYSVVDPVTRQPYALTHVQPRTEKDQRFVEQLRTEFEVGQHVRHAGVRRAIELKVRRTLLRKVTEAGLVLELVDGHPMDQRPPASKRELVTTIVRVAESLQAMHEAGLVHCDLKPNNILLLSDGGVKVIDLGQACPAGTAKSRVQGTPDYIAPEQVRREPVSPRTDVYNLGATMYWALTSRALPTMYTAGRGNNAFLLEQNIPTPRELNPRVAEPLSNLVMQCVHTKPARRPQSMRELIPRLETILHLLNRRAERSTTPRTLVA